MENNLKQQVRDYSPFLDELENDDGWVIYSHNIAQFWEPKEVGDNIKGIFCERRQFPGQRGETFNSLLLLTKTGIIGVTEHKTMEEDFIDVQLGELVSITYMGEATSNQGNTYKKYFIKRKNLNIQGGFQSGSVVKQEYNQKDHKPTNPVMDDADDPDARTEVECNCKLFEENNRREATGKDLLLMLETDPDMKDNPDLKKRYINQVTRMVEKGELKKG